MLVFWGNDRDAQTGQLDNIFEGQNGFLSVSYSIIGELGVVDSPPTGNNNSGADPMFVDIDGSNNIPGDLDDNVMLMPGSPAINAGNTPNITVTEDFFGSPRFVDDTGTPDTGVPDGALGMADIGAAEFQGTTPPACPADLNDDGDLNFFDISAFLTAFTNLDPIADFTGDGEWNFFDISAFLSPFRAGCP